MAIDNELTQNKLSTSEQKIVVRLQKLLERLKSGQHVQNRALKSVLTQKQFEQIAVLWSEQLKLRKFLADKPDSIIEYERRLKKATFTFSRADNYSARGRSKTAQKLFGQSDTEFENVLTYLQEIISAEPELIFWFDRNTQWTADGDLDLCPSAVPHVITSKSANNTGIKYTEEKRTKNQIKQQVIEDALNELLYEGDELSDEDMNALIKDKLAKLSAR